MNGRTVLMLKHAIRDAHVPINYPFQWRRIKAWWKSLSRPNKELAKKQLPLYLNLQAKESLKLAKQMGY